MNDGAAYDAFATSPDSQSKPLGDLIAINEGQTRTTSGKPP